ncbi:Senescence regulator [Heracleum sosnowskyi]|uniref:Senescence regulator n=1 Tax=Heracleum sosnowskyi TaxID=360622 RepID=A0AAD8N3B1_9APIA|nr:Senescence regulator [Heracleum sosnowskyi]
MATRKNYLYFGSEKINQVSNDLEFDESDVWNSVHVACTEPKRPFFSARAAKKFIKRNDDQGGDHGRDVPSTSLPVNVIDWSKVLRNEFTNRKVEFEEGENENEDEDERVPPHEYLARTRVASCSVHEGIGRTLKGRDMRMVRNAVWKRTGFED